MTTEIERAYPTLGFTMTPPRRFQTTCWAMISKLSDPSDHGASVALAEFCAGYRAPLLRFAEVAYPNDAEDLVQGFLERLIETGSLAAADPTRENLRTFLLTCFKRYISNRHRELSAAKRGGKALHVPLEAPLGVEDLTAGQEALYHRSWAQEVLERAVARLRQRWTSAGKAELFEALCPFLGFQRQEEERQGTVAIRFGMSRAALKMAIYRLRLDYREVLLLEISKTLQARSEKEILAELKNLMGWI